MGAILDLDRLPADVLGRLRERAAAGGRTVEAEAAAVIAEGVMRPPAVPAGDGPEAPSEADNAVYDFPRPLTGVLVRPAVGGVRLPAGPIILDETPE